MKKVIKVISLILILVILSTLLFGIAKATDNFKNWDSNHIKNIIDSWNPKKSNKSGFKAYNTKTGKEIDFTTNENLSFDDGIAFRAMSSAPGVEYEATSFSFNVIIEPVESTNKDFSVTLEYYVFDDEVEAVKEVEVSVVEGNRVTLTCKKPFNKRIRVLIVSNDNPEIKTGILLDFEALYVMTEEDLNNMIMNNTSFNGNEIIKTSSGNYDFKIKVFPWEDYKNKFNPESTKDDVIFNFGFNAIFLYKPDVIATKVIMPRFQTSSGVGCNLKGWRNTKIVDANLKELGGSDYKVLFDYDITYAHGKPFNKDVFFEEPFFLFFLKGISSNVFEKYNYSQIESNYLKSIYFDITYPEGYPEDKKFSFDSVKVTSTFDFVPVESLSVDVDNHTFR